eukprot:scaffold120582_cov26-Attheya_sp.AAC.1
MSDVECSVGGVAEVSHDVVAVDCCEGDGLCMLQRDHVHPACGERSNEIGILGGRRHQEGCQSRRQPHMMPCSCKCGCIGGGGILLLYGKRQFARAAAMDLRAQRTIITILITTSRI